MKKFTSLFLALIMCTTLWACGTEEKPVEQTSTNEQTQLTEQETITEEISIDEEVPTDEQAPSAIEVALGETIGLEFVEITFEEMGIEEDIKQSIKTGNVTRIFGPDAEEGKKFIYLRGTIKNVAKEALPVYDFFLGEFDIDGYKYEISATDCDVYTSNGETESTVDPLTSLTFMMYASIPNELADNHTSINYRFGFYDMFDNEELSRNRAFEDDPISFCPYQYSFVLK